MTALVVDSDMLVSTRDLIISGRYSAAVGALDMLTAHAPRKPENPATGKQTWYLFLLTGKDWRLLGLSYDEAHGVIEDLTTTGETTYRGQHYRTTASGDKMLAKRRKSSSIPF